MSDDLDEAMIALVRRWGRRGINEATIWTVLRVEVPDLVPAVCARAIERLVVEGRLYRDRRRTRTMIKAAGCGSKVATFDEPDLGLF